MLPLIATIVGSYLLGSITFAYLVVRWMGRGDIREQGSGNVGATNVLRQHGKMAGIVTMLFDVAKGCAAVWLARLLLPSSPQYWGAAGVAAILGHVFPVWLKFRGGKGVATGLGVFLVLAPLAAGLAAVVFVAVVALTRYVSLGSIFASATLPVAMQLLDRWPRPWVWAAAAAAVLIIAKHHENVRRILARSERRLGSPAQ